MPRTSSVWPTVFACAARAIRRAIRSGATPRSALSATRRLVAIARETGAAIHVLHVSTADEMRFLADHKDIASVEVTPHHLTFSADDYLRLGTLLQMNPPVRDAEHRAGIWAGVADGTADILGSDHAPHTLEEKALSYPQSPSGMPGVQTLVPVMLDHVARGRLSLAPLHGHDQRRAGAALRHRRQRAASPSATTPISPSST